MSLAKVAAPSPGLPWFPFGMQPRLIVPASRSRAKEHWTSRWWGRQRTRMSRKGSLVDAYLRGAACRSLSVGSLIQVMYRGKGRLLYQAGHMGHAPSPRSSKAHPVRGRRYL